MLTKPLRWLAEVGLKSKEKQEQKTGATGGS
jgi:hypothetical protein